MRHQRMLLKPREQTELQDKAQKAATQSIKQKRFTLSPMIRSWHNVKNFGSLQWDKAQQ